MTHLGREARALVLAGLAALLVAGCVHYPTVNDIGGPRIVPRNGHAVRQPGGLLFYVDLDSQGKYGDVLTGIVSPAAKTAQLVSETGAPIERLIIPAASVVRFEAKGPHGVLGELAREVAPGDTIIVTLTFEKSGGVGVITTVE